MKKILFLSSALAMTTLVAYADDVTPNTDKKITGGAGTCTVDVLGVSDNNATANTIAVWSLNSYECAPGQYLDVTDNVAECTECPIGSYCPGGTFTVEANNSKNACPTDYTSDVAATAETECYVGCEAQCVQQECPEHSKNCVNGEFKTNGKQYLNAECNAYPSLCPILDFNCDTGYTKTLLTVSQLPYEGNFVHNSCPLDNDASDKSVVYNYCEYGTGAGEYFVSNDPEDFGIKYVFSVNNYGPDTQGVVATTYTDENGEVQTVYTLPYADFKSGLNGGNHVWYRPDELLFLDSDERLIFDFSMDYLYSGEISQKLYERLENELPPKAQEDVLNAIKELEQDSSLSKMQQVAFRLYKTYTNSVKTDVPWIYLGEYDEESMNNSYLREMVEVYSVVLASIYPETGVTYCRYHTINVDWNPDNGGDAIQNMCYYGGGIDVPDDPVRPGYTFMGWKLVE